MSAKLDTRQILVFLAFTFGISWVTGLIIYLTGGLVNSPSIVSGLTLAFVLLALPYMCAPALANVLTRWVTHEGFHDGKVRPNLRREWPFWLAAWFLPAVMTLVGAAIFFLIFPQSFDPSLSTLRARLAVSPLAASLSPWAAFAVVVLQAAIISPLANGLFTFGEEFGWRAYLLPRLLPLGERKAMLAVGVIWGIWHWPVIFMGYEYGFQYPGYPWVGPLLFIWFTTCAAIFLGWVALRAGSVWPAVIGHAAINGVAVAPVLLEAGRSDPLLGPLPVGLIGSLGFALIAAAIFIWGLKGQEDVSRMPRMDE